MKILDLGCGDNKVDGSIGIDIVRLPHVDIVHDLLSFPYPIKDKSFDVIYLRHTIEHFSIENINLILKECHRILKIDGIIRVHVPHVFSIAAHTDITHRSYFTFNSGRFWDRTYSKSYYHENENIWTLENVECSLTWFDWKGRILRYIDGVLSKILELRINYSLKSKTKPSLADRLVKKYSFQFVEIRWILKKASI